MNPISSKLISCVFLLPGTLITGVIVSKIGRPYHALLFGAHKLIAVGTIILIGVLINQLVKVQLGSLQIEIAAAIVTGVLFLALLVSGSLLALEPEIDLNLPAVVLKIHQVVPLLFAAAASATLFTLARGRG